MYKYVVFVSKGEDSYEAVFCRADDAVEALKTVKVCYPEWTTLFANIVPSNLDGLVDGTASYENFYAARTLRPVK